MTRFQPPTRWYEVRMGYRNHQSVYQYGIFQQRPFRCGERKPYRALLFTPILIAELTIILRSSLSIHMASHNTSIIEPATLQSNHCQRNLYFIITARRNSSASSASQSTSNSYHYQWHSSVASCNLATQTTSTTSAYHSDSTSPLSGPCASINHSWSGFAICILQHRHTCTTTSYSSYEAFFRVSTTSPPCMEYWIHSVVASPRFVLFGAETVDGRCRK